MFGATVAVPILTGIPVSVALFTAGFGTLFFHLLTKFKVPVFLGSSFAFISPIIAITSHYAGQENAIAYATGGIVLSGIIYAIFSIIIKYAGKERINRIFPPVITGTMIALIGLILASVAVNWASENWIVALIVIVVIIVIKLYSKGFISALPILIGIAVGYLCSLFFEIPVIEFTKWLSIPNFILPKFSLYAAGIILPAAIAPALEHIGDIYSVSMVTGQPFTEDPGLHRTILADGLATSFAGLLGGPANTTYSENTGVLALTKQYNPVIMRIAAIFAILLSFFQPLTVVIQTIPSAVMGGACIVLFGMIATTGLRVLVDNKIRFTSKNTLIMSIMLIIGIGGANFGVGPFVLQGLGLAAIIGVVLNVILIETE
jgi:uracil permease